MTAWRSQRNRVDRRDLEPGDGLHQGQPGLRPLLRRDVRRAFRGVPATPTSRASTCGSCPSSSEQPLRWRRPRMIFVNSMSDLFHEDIPTTVRRAGLRGDGGAPTGTRSRSSRSAHERLAELARRCPGPRTSGWASRSRTGGFVQRADHLRASRPPCASSAPSRCSGRSTASTSTDIDWLIAGGESGPRHRPMRADWVRDLRDRCEDEGVAFFFKQWGGHDRSRRPDLDGRTWDEMPVAPPASWYGRTNPLLRR